MSTRTELGRKATRPSVDGGNNLVSHVEEVWPNNFFILSRGPLAFDENRSTRRSLQKLRPAHPVAYFSVGIRIDIPLDWLRTSGGIHGQSVAGF